MEEIIAKIEELSAQNLSACMQCGKCSAGCPMVDSMEILPNQVIRLLQLGSVDETLEKNSIWRCASCLTCRARCPRGVELPKVMEALRQLVLRKNISFVEPEKIDGKKIEEMPQICFIANFRKFTP
jgi:heterodisulfide reductase subunit C